MSELVPLPANGRTFTGYTRVRLGDVTPRGRLRLDAIARYLQDVSNDDTVDAGLEEDLTWVVRRTVLEIRQFPVFREHLDLTTWCGGIGPRWAERRIAVRGDLGAVLDAAVLWVFLDPASGRPVRLPTAFHDLYAEAAGGRTVGARLVHPDPPASGAEHLDFPLRVSDYDLLAHVNNAVAWSVVEEVLSGRPELRSGDGHVLRGEVEYRAPIDRRDAIDVEVEHGPDGMRAWLLVDGAVAVSARVAVDQVSAATR